MEDKKNTLASIYLVGTLIIYILLIFINIYVYINGTSCTVNNCHTICYGFQALTLPINLITVIIFIICSSYQILYFKNIKKLMELNGLLVICITIIVLLLIFYWSISFPVKKMYQQNPKCLCTAAFNCQEKDNRNLECDYCLDIDCTELGKTTCPNR